MTDNSILARKEPHTHQDKEKIKSKKSVFHAIPRTHLVPEDSPAYWGYLRREQVSGLCFSVIFSLIAPLD